VFSILRALEREDYVEGRVLGEGTMVVLGGEGDAWREVDEDGGLRYVWWGRRRRGT